MSIAKNAYQILWYLLLFMAEIVDWYLWLWHHVQEYILQCSILYKNFQKDQTMSMDDVDRTLLEQSIRYLTKLPKHVNIIIARNTSNSKINENALIRILNYALIMDIKCISFFDCRIVPSDASLSKSNNNIISTNRWPKKDFESLQLDRLRCPKPIQCKRTNQYHVTWFLPSNGNKFNLMVTNGYHKETSQKLINGAKQKHSSLIPSIDHKTKCLQIYEINYSHGRPLLAKVCRDLYKQKEFISLESLISSEKRSKLMDKITFELSRHLGDLCEPDLTILFDQQICLYGILPWHTRFTEFQLASNTDGHFRAQHFLKILYKYAHCEQRYGK